MTKKYIRFEKRVADGFKAKDMYSPVEILTARQYALRKNREAKNHKPVVLRFS